MASYTIDQELNGIEIMFDEKPTTETLTALKAAGYRWHRVKKIWYAKQTRRLTLAASLAGLSETTEKPAIVDDQAELKAVYTDIITEYWKDQRMIDHCIKNAAYIVSLDNGDIYEIERAEIKKDFCFGYGMNGISDDQDYKEAADMMHHADTNESYFINENMKYYDDIIEAMKDKDIKKYKYVKYCGKCDHRLKSIGFYRYYQEPENKLTDCQALTEAEIKAVIDGLEIVKKQFRKRIDTYLKKYGLTKLHTWTYLRD